MCEKRREEIYELDGIMKTDDGNIHAHSINYESGIIEYLIDLGLDIEETNWLDFIDDNDLSLRIYPYYIETSDEIIRVKSTIDETIHKRPLMVEGMARHTAEQLKQLRSKDSLSLYELSQIENWSSKNLKLMK